MPLKLLIADDERLFRQSLRFLLETVADIKVVAEAADGHEAVVMARETQPNIALLDVDMPKMDGIKAAKLISTVTPATKILMLSVHRDDQKVISARKAGALGYILKDADRGHLIEIIRHTHAGKTPSSPYLAQLTLEEASNGKTIPNQDRIMQSAERFGLAELELRILRLVTEGLSNEEISELICLSRETIKGHLKTLFRKLDVKNRTEAAVLSVREGLA